MKVLIFGGRDWNDWPFLLEELDRINKEKRFSLVINGGQSAYDRTTNQFFGADYQAAAWARFRRVPVRFYKAEWQKHGKAAGPIRNRRMLEEGKPEMGIMFPRANGTIGPGSADMSRQLRAAGIKVIEIERGKHVG